VLTTLLSNISTAHCQSIDSVYTFTPSEVKEIAYVIESREILKQDTADYLSKISKLEIKISTLGEISDRLQKMNDKSKTYVSVLEQDVNTLIDERELLIKNANKLEKTNNILKVGIVGALLIGLII